MAGEGQFCLTPRLVGLIITPKIRLVLLTRESCEPDAQIWNVNAVSCDGVD